MSIPLVAETTVNMHAVDAQLRERLKMLQSAQQTEEVRRAIAKLEFALEAVNDSCFPSMDIPITVR